MHIAQGILRAINVNKLVDAGCIFIFWIADLFALLNNKMDGKQQMRQSIISSKWSYLYFLILTILFFP